MPRGAGLLNNWVGEKLPIGQGIVKATRLSDGATLEIRVNEKYQKLGDDAFEIATNLKDTGSALDAIDAIEQLGYLVPGHGYVGTGAAEAARIAIRGINDYNNRQRAAIEGNDSSNGQSGAGDAGGTSGSDGNSPPPPPPPNMEWQPTIIVSNNGHDFTQARVGRTRLRYAAFKESVQ